MNNAAIPKSKTWNIRIAICLLLAPLVSCSYAPPRKSAPYSQPPAQANRIIEILDYQGYSDGVELAYWVSTYINGGIPALEKLDEFASYYVFAAEQYSSSLDTLRQWADNFSIEHDFPQLVFLRVYRRLTSNISASPDELYGGFFETMVKRAAMHRWPLAQRYGGIWALVRRAQPSDSLGASAGPSGSPDGEPDTSVEPAAAAQPDAAAAADWYDDSRIYTYLIIGIISKTEIENSLKVLMNDITIDKTFTRAQVSAVNSLKSNFFNDF